MEKKIIQKNQKGILNISSTKNNTIATLQDVHGNVLCWSSCGAMSHKDNPLKKFKGKAKKSEHAAFLVIKAVCSKARNYGIKFVSVYLKHYGSAINVFAHGIKKLGLVISSVYDNTPIAFNGCRSQKKRRKKRLIKNKNYDYDKPRYKKE